MTAVKTRKKLIEVALPLEAINAASAREKSIRHGHPSTLHLWVGAAPAAAARAVIFAQMVDDPSEYVDVLLRVPETRRAAERELKKRKALYETLRAEAEPGPPLRLDEIAPADLERQRLFRLIEQLVQWENTTNEDVLQKARHEIWASWRRACADNAGHPRAAALFEPAKAARLPRPLRRRRRPAAGAQRLGLEAHASDINPVAVLNNKAMIEILAALCQPPAGASRPRTGCGTGRARRAGRGCAPLRPMDARRGRRSGSPPLPEGGGDGGDGAGEAGPQAVLGQKLTVIAWLWARTVRSPNPAFAQVEVPLVSSFLLSTKAGKEAWVDPLIEDGSYRFAVKVGKPQTPRR